MRYGEDMNTMTHEARPTTQTAHADDLGVAAYLTARQLGQSVESAMHARDLAYAAALRG